MIVGKGEFIARFQCCVFREMFRSRSNWFHRVNGCLEQERKRGGLFGWWRGGNSTRQRSPTTDTIHEERTLLGNKPLKMKEGNLLHSNRTDYLLKFDIGDQILTLYFDGLLSQLRWSSNICRKGWIKKKNHKNLNRNLQDRIIKNRKVRQGCPTP